MLHELLTEALGQPWTKRQLRVLEQINGAETVVEVRGTEAAVGRGRQRQWLSMMHASGQRTACPCAPPSQISYQTLPNFTKQAVQRVDKLRAASTSTEGIEVPEHMGTTPTSAARAASAPPGAVLRGADGASDETVSTPKQLTPRTAAAEVLRINPLPQPPTRRLDQASWGNWQSTQVQELVSIPSSAVRIEPGVFSGS